MDSNDEEEYDEEEDDEEEYDDEYDEEEYDDDEYEQEYNEIGNNFINANTLEEIENILENIPENDIEEVINYFDNRGNNKFMLSIITKNIDIFNYLLYNYYEYIDIEHTNKNGDNALILSIPEEDSFLLNLLDVFPDVNLNVYNKENQTPLLLSLNKSIEITRLLLDRGADVNFSNEENDLYDPLIIATLSTNMEAIQLLIEYGGDPLRVVNGESAMSVIKDIINSTDETLDETEDQDAINQHEQDIQEYYNIIDLFINTPHYPNENTNVVNTTEECSICLNNDVDYTTNCGHSFHKECLRNVKINDQGHSICPNCRGLDMFFGNNRSPRRKIRRRTSIHF